MDDFKDFFKDLRDRVSNPFFTSFIISWLLTNWPITIAIIFYDDADVKADGFRSFYQLIKFYATPMTVLVEPLFWAIVVTYSFPYVKSIIKLHNAKIVAQNESDILKKTNSQSVSLVRYSEMLDETKKSQQELADLIESQSSIKIENIKLQGELNDKGMELIELDKRHKEYGNYIESLKQVSFLDILQGTWTTTRVNWGGGKEVWHIENDFLIIEDKEYYYLRNLTYNPFTKQGTFTLLASNVSRSITGSHESSALTYFVTVQDSNTIVHGNQLRSVKGYSMKRKFY